MAKHTPHATHKNLAKKTKHRHVVLKPHHSKPYRKRQILFLVVSSVVLAVSVLKIGANIGSQQTADVPVVNTSSQKASSITIVKSSFGFSTSLDGNIFAVSGTAVNDAGVAHNVSQNDLHPGDSLTSLIIKPRTGTVPRAEAASQLSIIVNPSTDAYAAARAKAPSAATSGEVAAGLFIQTATSEYDVSILSTKADTLHGVPVQKTTYQYTPKFKGGNSYAVIWTGVTGGRAFALKLQGLVGSSNVPSVFSSVFDSLTFASDEGVKGAFTSIFAPKVSADPAKLNTKYLSDALSPAVVKIYHIVCGTLTAYGTPLLANTCVGFSGSGFIATSNGYIATNGHVVIYGAKDRFVDILTSSPNVLHAFLKGFGLNDSQVAAASGDPATLASIISKIYDIPDSQLNFADSNEATLVALGSVVPKFTTITKSSELDALKKDSDNFKQAKVVGYDYSSKDVLTAIADPKLGFSSSDVALIKIDVKNAPTIAISNGQVTQNEKIVVMGFPGDADNGLTDNTELSVSVTDGVISSIRQAAGGNGKLYQSDADASHGNSGGPAIDETGKVIGLLTYRQSGDTVGNAAKSYVRDIIDFNELAKRSSVKLDSTSSTQAAWQEGLQLFSLSHYSAAVKKFDIVQQAFPAHRLVAAYIKSSQDAIHAGKDVKDIPLALIIASGTVGVLGVITAITMVIRHRVHHHLYNAFQPTMPGGVPPKEGFEVSAASEPAESEEVETETADPKTVSDEQKLSQKVTIK